MSQKPYVGMDVHWFNQGERRNGFVLGKITRLASDGWTAEISLIEPRSPSLRPVQVVKWMGDEAHKQDPKPEYLRRGGGWDFIPELSANHDVAALAARVVELATFIKELTRNPLAPANEQSEPKPPRKMKLKTVADAKPEEIAKLLELAEKYSRSYDIKLRMGPRWPLAAVEELLTKHGKLQPVGSE